ncbi:hypothetical protein KVR01_012043 [Diaporthe batatas]|uniref:uncharacterized protein n=1 Tax=Diaporthe batatas TaxID=748121 RepID=UPI001D05BE38|nr:uncharacterized protein KVR01_012043 [Diaporthe batatas]KAG8158282.1 hypothetical protein KVR01_012043 [Diaporthe batatas]
MECPSDSPSKGFQQNDLELLHSGILADGTIKCQGRTWKEATSCEVEFPEAEPEAVDFMIRHLYREELDVSALNTPLLCLSCWKLADYLRLVSLKSVVRSAINDHLNAMLLLASTDEDLEYLTGCGRKPIWLGHFMDAFREVCAHAVFRPLQAEFVAFLWVTRLEMLDLREIWDTLDEHKDVRAKLLHLLIRQERGIVDGTSSRLIPRGRLIDAAIRNKSRPEAGGFEDSRCFRCDVRYMLTDDPWFYNPLPMQHYTQCNTIGRTQWCKQCADFINASRTQGWRLDRPEEKSTMKTFKLKAWTWYHDDLDQAQ